MMADILTNNPEILVQDPGFIRAPYPLTWVELSDYRAFWRGLNPGPWPGTDERTAFLIDDQTAYAIYGAKNGAILGHIAYRLRIPMEVHNDKIVMGKIKGNLLDTTKFLLGSTYSKLNEEDRRLICCAHSVDLLPIADKFREVVLKRFDTLIANCVGDFRTLITALLLLTKPAVVKYEPSAPVSRGFVRGKTHIYHSYDTVKITLDRPKIAHEFTKTLARPSGGGGHKRRHEVRGFWVHNAEASRQPEGHVHQWVKATDFGSAKARNPDRYRCAACGGKRWWKEAHVRGSSLEGFTSKRYTVTARTEKIILTDTGV